MKDSEKTLRALLDMVKGVRAAGNLILAQGLLDGPVFEYSQRTAEIKYIIANNISSEQIRDFLTKLPDFEFTKARTQAWVYLLPDILHSIFANTNVTAATYRKIKHLNEQFNAIEAVIRKM